jgi:hypothetical protein
MKIRQFPRHALHHPPRPKTIAPLDPGTTTNIVPPFPILSKSWTSRLHLATLQQPDDPATISPRHAKDAVHRGPGHGAGRRISVPSVARFCAGRRSSNLESSLTHECRPAMTTQPARAPAKRRRRRRRMTPKAISRRKIRAHNQRMRARAIRQQRSAQTRTSES